MDQTVNRGYPYPQCEPPLVEDESNAPLQTRLLAEAMDADFDTVSNLITATYQMPTTIITMAGPTAIASGGTIVFTATEHDTDGWADLPGITVADAGLYLITLSVQETTASVALGMVQFTNNGNGFYLQGTSPTAVGFGRMAANGITILQAGVTLGARLTYTGAASSFGNARLSCTRMVAF